MNLDEKVDKILDQINELGKITAVQEQKLREINHRMGDGQQRNILSQEIMTREMNKKLDRFDAILSNKVDIDEYKQAFSSMKEALSQDRRTLVIIACILMIGSGMASNVEPIRKLIMYIFGVH